MVCDEASKVLRSSPKGYERSAHFVSRYHPFARIDAMLSAHRAPVAQCRASPMITSTTMSSTMAISSVSLRAACASPFSMA